MLIEVSAAGFREGLAAVVPCGVTVHGAGSGFESPAGRKKRRVDKRDLFRNIASEIS